jgi:choline dehydrogenase-like flavoprotein
MDFEGWAEAGAIGWSWPEVLPYFRRPKTRAEAGDPWRGDSGPSHTRYGPLNNPLYCAFGHRDDAHGVVDPERRVIDAEGLRVVDSGVMPRGG